jgi:succinoglycan biosynthesis transport protein ExoP
MPRDAMGRVASATDSATEFDLATLAQALWQRKRWIVIPTILAAIAAAIFVSVVTPMYRAESLLLIESRETVYSRPEGTERSTDRDRPDNEAIQSQVQLALSRDLARAVVRELKLADRPEFNPQGGGSFISGMMRMVGLARDPSRMTMEERVLERFYDRLSVYQVERSRVIAIDFRSENPVLAAEIANAIASRLIEFQKTAKQESMKQASHWLATEINELRGRVGDAESRAEQFRSNANLYLGGNNTSLSAQQLAETNSQLVTARAQKAEAEVKARLIREMLRTGRPIESSDVVNSELIRRLNEQRVTLRAQLAEQSSTLLDQHPRIKELKAQIADLEAQTRTEGEKLVRSLENDARMAGAQVETLSANLDQLKKQASALGSEDVQLRALEREAKSQRDLLESYLARYRDVTARESPDAVPADARILSQAVPPSTPYFPKKLPIVLIATLAAFICSATLIAVSELLNGDNIRRASMPVRESLPEPVAIQAPPAWIGPAEQPKPVKPEPAEKSRERRLAALAKHVSGLGKGIIVVTGTAENMMASDIAISLTRELAQEGPRVLLLDVDVAQTPVAALVPNPRAPGLADLVFGVANFGEVIQRDRASRIHVIAVGKGIRDTEALLSGERLAIVLGALSQTYDHVIVAAPVLTTLAGAQRLARFSSGAVIVAAEGDEGAGATVSDALAAKGFANIVVVSVKPEAAPPDSAPGREAA